MYKCSLVAELSLSVAVIAIHCSAEEHQAVSPSFGKDYKYSLVTGHWTLVIGHWFWHGRLCNKPFRIIGFGIPEAYNKQLVAHLLEHVHEWADQNGDSS